MTWSLLEMARSLTTAPWSVLARAPFAAPKPAELGGPGGSGVLEGTVEPWPHGAPEAAAAWGPGTLGAAGATWLPLLGTVRWSADPADLDHPDALTCWMRTRLSDAHHAALIARGRADAQAARMASDIVAAFRARHPLGSSPAWDGAMEPALRAVRLVHVAALLEDCRAGGVDGADLGPIARALAEHEAHLLARSDWRLHFSGNHHLVALAGAWYLAAHLPATPARRRRARGLLALFWREACRQVRPDGVHFESSTAYHLLAVETMAHVALRASALGFERPAWASARLAAAADALALLARPDGTLAAIGDGDDASFLSFSPAAEPPPALDARPALALLALAAGHPAAAARAGEDPRALAAATWLAGPDAAHRLAALAGQGRPALAAQGRPALAGQGRPALAARAHDVAPRPAVFPEGGLVVLGLSGAPAVHVTVSCTAAGRAGTGGHGHDDAGSYELWAGQSLVVDRGTGAYARDISLRQALRGPAAHALAQVDSRAMNEPGPLFRRENWAKPFITGFSGVRGGAVAIGHHGYCRAPGAVSVLRTLTLDRSRRLEVVDELRGDGEHVVVLRVPLAPGLEAALEMPGAAAASRVAASIRRGDTLLARCEVSAEGAQGAVAAAAARVVDVVHAARQLELVPARTIEIEWRLTLPARVRHVISLA